jgi:hypothetical protein
VFAVVAARRDSAESAEILGWVRKISTSPKTDMTGGRRLRTLRDDILPSEVMVHCCVEAGPQPLARLQQSSRQCHRALMASPNGQACWKLLCRRHHCANEDRAWDDRTNGWEQEELKHGWYGFWVRHCAESWGVNHRRQLVAPHALRWDTAISKSTVVTRFIEGTHPDWGLDRKEWKLERGLASLVDIMDEYQWLAKCGFKNFGSVEQELFAFTREEEALMAAEGDQGVEEESYRLQWVDPVPIHEECKRRVYHKLAMQWGEEALLGHMAPPLLVPKILASLEFEVPTPYEELQSEGERQTARERRIRRVQAQGAELDALAQSHEGVVRAFEATGPKAGAQLVLPPAPPGVRARVHAVAEELGLCHESEQWGGWSLHHGLCDKPTRAGSRKRLVVWAA